MSLDRLHEPTILRPSSSNTSSSNQSAPSDVRADLARLTAVRDELSLELSTYSSVLVSNQCDMQTPLIDRQGFPRSDIDVAGVRTARAKIIRLRNDLRQVETELEQVVLKGLPRIEQDDRARNQATTSDIETDALPNASTEQPLEPFARIDRVFPGSPADAAGLARDDLLLSIGHVDATNHESLSAVASLVGRSENTMLDIRIKRAQHQLSLRLTPRTGWGGRGLLGCHIVPV